MCIAILVKEGASVPMEYLIEGQRMNPDGCGLGWVENEQLWYYKTMDFNDWLEMYNNLIERCGNIQMLIHFRITSKGATTTEMCHPFIIDDDHILIHNGTISSINKALLVNGRSDTAVFAEEILSKLDKGWENNPTMIHILEEYIGYSKVVIMDRFNNITFLNERSGHWLDDVWYSNKSYIPVVKMFKKSDNYAFDNYDEWYTGYNKVAMNIKTRYEQCSSCKKTYDYLEMKWLDKKLLCKKCATKTKVTNTKKDSSDLILEAHLAMGTYDSTREKIKIYKMEACSVCDVNFFIDELYNIWVESNIQEFNNILCVCQTCFVDLYIDDDTISLEVL